MTDNRDSAEPTWIGIALVAAEAIVVHLDTLFKLLKLYKIAFLKWKLLPICEY